MPPAHRPRQRHVRQQQRRKPDVRLRVQPVLAQPGLEGRLGERAPVGLGEEGRGLRGEVEGCGGVREEEAGQRRRRG